MFIRVADIDVDASKVCGFQLVYDSGAKNYQIAILLVGDRQLVTCGLTLDIATKIKQEAIDLIDDDGKKAHLTTKYQEFVPAPSSPVRSTNAAPPVTPSPSLVPSFVPPPDAPKGKRHRTRYTPYLKSQRRVQFTDTDHFPSQDRIRISIVACLYVSEGPMRGLRFWEAVPRASGMDICQVLDGLIEDGTVRVVPEDLSTKGHLDQLYALCSRLPPTPSPSPSSSPGLCPSPIECKQKEVDVDEREIEILEVEEKEPDPLITTILKLKVDDEVWELDSFISVTPDNAEDFNATVFVGQITKMFKKHSKPVEMVQDDQDIDIEFNWLYQAMDLPEHVPWRNISSGKLQRESFLLSNSKEVFNITFVHGLHKGVKRWDISYFYDHDKQKVQPLSDDDSVGEDEFKASDADADSDLESVQGLEPESDSDSDSDYTVTCLQRKEGLFRDFLLISPDGKDQEESRFWIEDLRRIVDINRQIGTHANQALMEQIMSGLETSFIEPLDAAKVGICSLCNTTKTLSRTMRMKVEGRFQRYHIGATCAKKAEILSRVFRAIKQAREEFQAKRTMSRAQFSELYRNFVRDTKCSS